jgi:hypothetical protein
MAKTNKISVQIDEADMNLMLDAIETVNSKLKSLVVLSDEERRRLPKTGDKTFAFVSSCLDYAKTNPSLVPMYLEIDEFEKDMAAVSDLLRVLRPIHQLYQRLDDTVMQAGGEAYQAALSFYSSLKSAAKAGVPGAKTIQNDLAERFPGRGKTKVEEQGGFAPHPE